MQEDQTIIINNKPTVLREAKRFIYPFFGIHMLAFGVSGFVISYAVNDIFFAAMHGGIAIFVYTVFYLVIFGIDKVLWLAINSLLSIGWIMTVLGTIVGLFGQDISAYPRYAHIIPGTYLVLYLFLRRHAIIDGLGWLTKSPTQAEWI
jgi:hypothetical protein